MRTFTLIILAESMVAVVLIQNIELLICVTPYLSLKHMMYGLALSIVYMPEVVVQNLVPSPSVYLGLMDGSSYQTVLGELVVSVAGSGVALAKGKLINGTRSVESNKKIS